MIEDLLIKEIQQGSEDAFRELVENYKDMVYNTCYGFLQNKQDADDVAQEVFIKVYTNISSFKYQSKLSTWIYRIAVNLSLNQLKSRKKQKLSTEDIETLKNQNDSDENVIQEAREKILYAAINELPESQKKVIILSKMEKLSYKEITEVLDISLSSVESLIFRAKQNLKRNWRKK